MKKRGRETEKESREGERATKLVASDDNIPLDAIIFIADRMRELLARMEHCLSLFSH